MGLDSTDDRRGVQAGSGRPTELTGSTACARTFELIGLSELLGLTPGAAPPGLRAASQARSTGRVSVSVALLRGVNVGTHRRVTMTALRGALSSAGYPDATTYLQSGNVVLDGSGARPADVARSIETALRRELGLDVDVIVRTGAQLSKLATANPFLRRRVDRGALHCGFLKMRPAAAAVRALNAHSFGRDEFLLRGTELHLHYPDGLGRSKMSPASFERALAVPITVRKWSVVTALLELTASTQLAAKRA